MSVHVEELTSELTVVDGDLPLSLAQIEKLTKLVIQRIEQRKRQNAQHRESTSPRDSAISPSGAEGR